MGRRLKEIAAPDVLYLDTADATERFVSSLAGAPSVAVDTEGASFHKFVDRVYLLQLSVPGRSAIIDPLAVANPPGLGALLEDRAVQVIFHDADYDLRLLRQDFGWKATNIFDTRIAAQLLGLRAFGLQALLEKYFGVALDKKHQRADWSLRPLPQGMLDYAAQDTRYLIELRDKLADELKALGRRAWADEEFARLEQIQWTPEPPDTSFLRMKGARDLSRRELALLRELVKWRDTVGAELDRAVFRVIGNEALLEIAQQAPRTRDALGAIRGVPRGILERRTDDILAAVQRGLEVPENDLPRFPRGLRYDKDPDFDARVAILKTVRDDAATRLNLDPGVLCSRDRLETIARLKPESVERLSEVKDLRRWQIAEMGQAFLDALQKPR